MKKTLVFAFLTLSILAVFCACGNGTKKGKSSGDTVIVGITNDMDSLDPHKAVAAGTREVLYNIFEGLVKADNKNEKNFDYHVCFVFHT